MADMCTTVIIENPNPGWGDDGQTTLTDFEESFEDHWDEGTEATEGIGGWSKYQVDNLYDFAIDYTKAWPAAIITITEEWIGEGGPETTVSVYQAGELQRDRSRHSALVPIILPELLENVRAGLRAYEVDPSYPHFIEATRALVAALEVSE